uniref:Uncharacterized protein n=1 Tax=Fusarium oxysporum (strain Fo5176) TaxID=660025 RepID=A0A0D2XAZ5_FUSOF
MPNNLHVVALVDDQAMVALGSLGEVDGHNVGSQEVECAKLAIQRPSQGVRACAQVHRLVLVGGGGTSFHQKKTQAEQDRPQELRRLTELREQYRGEMRGEMRRSRLSEGSCVKQAAGGEPWNQPLKGCHWAFRDGL